MTKEIILVEVLNGGDLSTEKSKAFTRTYDAESYFIELLKEFGITDEDTIDSALDNGYYDVEVPFPTPSSLATCEKSVSIKEITLEEN